MIVFSLQWRLTKPYRSSLPASIRTVSGFILVLLLASCSSNGVVFDPTKAHHGDGEFISNKKSSSLAWIALNRKEGKPPVIDHEAVKAFVTAVDMSLIESKAEVPRATWIGHATVLVQYQDINYLTDPHLTQYPFPIHFLVDKRFTQPAITMKQMPEIDFIVISHNHFDHLDLDTVEFFGDSVTWYVPLGLKAWFVDQDISADKVIELDWWESHQFDDKTTVTITPSVHWSTRTLFDVNESLWGSWSVDIDGFRSWFAGDTGYIESVFEEIGERQGPFRLAMIPIGSYAPRYFMSDSHIDPGQAVKIHKDILARQSMPIHWATFQLSHEPVLEPPELLVEAMEKNQLPLEDFKPVKIGETLRLD